MLVGFCFSRLRRNGKEELNNCRFDSYDGTDWEDWVGLRVDFTEISQRFKISNT